MKNTGRFVKAMKKSHSFKWEDNRTSIFSVLKATEGGPGVDTSLVLLRNAGIPCRRYSPGSVYIGHVAVEVPFRFERRAEKVLFG